MSKKAFVVLVFGGVFQTFIPDYILFSQTAYPDTEVIVLFADKKINRCVKKGLDILKDNNFKFTIFNIYDTIKKSGIRNTSFFRAALRWVIDIPYFNKFDEIYIGDIDLLIMKEKDDLFTQHRKHSEFLNLPYSDIVRQERVIKTTLLKKIKYSLIFKIKGFKNVWATPKYVVTTEMTGLRYIKVKEYFEKVSINFEKYKNLLDSYFSNNDTGYPFYIPTFNDQQLLYMLMKDSFGGVPKSSNNDGIECTETNSFSYRPHHGVHLKIFHNNDFETIRRIGTSKAYLGYYKEFKKIYKTPLWEQLSVSRNKYYRKILKNMINFIETL